MTEKKQLPGSNSPPMSPAPPPRRYQVPPTITARIISPDLNDIRDALSAIRTGLSTKADTDKMDRLMNNLGPRMKELQSKLKEVDSITTSLRRNEGASGIGGGITGTGVTAGVGRNATLEDTRVAVEDVARALSAHPDRDETVHLSHEIARENAHKVVNAFRGELGAHEERLFHGLCDTIRKCVTRARLCHLLPNADGMRLHSLCAGKFLGLEG